MDVRIETITADILTTSTGMLHGAKFLRKLFKLPFRTHSYWECSIIEYITPKLDKRLNKFGKLMINSKNV